MSQPGNSQPGDPGPGSLAPGVSAAVTPAVQKRVLYVAIVASFMAFLDSSVVNLALPAISRELGGGLVVQQWVVDAYLLSLCLLYTSDAADE